MTHRNVFRPKVSFFLATQDPKLHIEAKIINNKKMTSNPGPYFLLQKQEHCFMNICTRQIDKQEGIPVLAALVGIKHWQNITLAHSSPNPYTTNNRFTQYCLSKKFCPFLYSKSLYKIGQDSLNMQDHILKYRMTKKSCPMLQYTYYIELDTTYWICCVLC